MSLALATNLQCTYNALQRIATHVQHDIMFVLEPDTLSHRGCGPSQDIYTAHGSKSPHHSRTRKPWASLLQCLFNALYALKVVDF